MLDKFLNVVSIGLRPPVPLELRSDFAMATPDEQAKARQKHAGRQLRWSRVIGAVLSVLVLFKGWEWGLGAAIGLGPGMAKATEVQTLRDEVAAANAQVALQRAESASFRTEYRRDRLETELKSIKGEEVTLLTTIGEARARGETPPAYVRTRLGDIQARRDEIVRILTSLGTPPP